MMNYLMLFILLFIVYYYFFWNISGRCTSVDFYKLPSWLRALILLTETKFRSGDARFVRPAFYFGAIGFTWNGILQEKYVKFTGITIHLIPTHWNLTKYVAGDQFWKYQYRLGRYSEVLCQP